jgi:hypothetical protein
LRGSIDVDEGGVTMTTALAATSSFTTGAVLSWSVPLALVAIVLTWWAIVMTIRAFRARADSG